MLAMKLIKWKDSGLCPEIIDNDYVYDFDVTKLSIHTRNLGLAGIEVYDILRDEFGIQIEFGDIGNVLAIISVGDRELKLNGFWEPCRRFVAVSARNPLICWIMNISIHWW